MRLLFAWQSAFGRGANAASLALALALGAASIPRAQAELTSEVKMHAGQPALYVNGKVTSQILAAPYRISATNIADVTDFYKGGVRIFNVYYRFRWTGPTTYDFTGPDGALDAAIKAYPDALFIPRMLLTPGAWFAQTYPDEISLRDDGSVAGMFGGGNTNAGAGGHPSFSSKHYKELSQKTVTDVIKHIEEKYGDHMVGYQVGNGFGGEWLPFNSFWETRGNAPHPTKFGVEDYSVAARDDFRRWLKETYKSDDALRKAWGSTTVTLSTAWIPNEVTRYSTTNGIFFDPAKSRQVPDWFWFYNDSVATVLLDNAEWIKEATNYKKIVGAFFGYLWCNFPNLSQVHSGHLGIERVIAAKDVDFFCSPYTYDNKYVGGPNNSQSLPEAAQIHGKLYFNEDDTETYITKRQWRGGDSLNNPQDWDETKGLLIRDFAYSFTKGMGLWWTDLFGGTFHDDKVIDLFATLSKLDRDSLDQDKSSVAQICVVLDPKSFTYTGDGDPIFNAVLTAQKQWQLGYIGAPWEPMLLSDFSSGKMKPYKLYIFLNTWHVTPEQRDAVHAKLKKDGATAMWVYAPGYLGDKELSTKTMQEMTGIKVGSDMTPGELHVDVTNVSNKFTQGVKPGLAYGTDVDVADIIKYYDHKIYLKDPRDPGLYRDLPGFRISPRFYADDPQATVLGTLAGLNKTGLAIKPQDGWTSIYSSAPIIPASLIRSVAKASGIHIYSDANDIVYANNGFLCVYATSAGKHTIQLPKKSKVVDLVDHKTITENASEFTLDFKANTAVLLGLE